MNYVAAFIKNDCGVLNEVWQEAAPVLNSVYWLSEL